jgi:hypothetical protein
MLKKLGLAAAFSLMAAAPAWAENACGSEPIPPALPSAAEIGSMTPAAAQKAKHQAFVDVTTYQKGPLKDYRDCLDSDQSALKRQVADVQAQTKPDKDKIKELQASEAADSKAYDRSTDSEERVVNDFHAVSTAYCARGDVDKTSCPKT